MARTRKEGSDVGTMKYRETLYLVPPHMRNSILEWIESPLPPSHLGGFLYALLTNNLSECLARGDPMNVAGLKFWFVYLTNYAPSECWGSAEKVQAWYDNHPASGLLSHELKQSSG